MQSLPTTPNTGIPASRLGDSPPSHPEMPRRDTLGRSVPDEKTAPVIARSIAAAPDPCRSLQGFLFLDLVARVLIWGSSFAFAIMLMTALKWWPSSEIVGAGPADAWAWGGAIAKWVILFNLIYVAELVLLRLPIPQPAQGIYSTNKPPDIRTHAGRQLIWSCLIAILTKARYEAPFPGFLVFHIANLPPMRWAMGRVFGPK